MTAEASSGLDVSYKVIRGNVELEGNTLGILGPGSVEIWACQGGNEGYFPADSAGQVFCINPLKPVISKSIVDDNIVLSSNADTGNQWFLEGEPISGETGKEIVVVESGTYSVTVVIDDCNSEFSDPLITDILSDPEMAEAELIIYPNPTGNFLSIQIPKESYRTEYHIHIVDMNGKFVYRSMEYTVSQGEIHLDISRLNSGLYSCILEDRESGHHYMSLFMIQR